MRPIQLIFVLSCLLAAAVSSPAGFNRFLVVPRTISTTVTATVVTESTTPTTSVCYSLAAGVVNKCRRRRELLEDNQSIEATEPLKVETTVAPGAKAIDSKAEPAGSEVLPQIASSIQNTEGLAEVVITDLDSICKGRGASPLFGGLAQAFGITVLTTTTFSATSTSTKFVPSVTIKTVTVNCDPVDLAIPVTKCA